jgi:hypothetical protein
MTDRGTVSIDFDKFTASLVGLPVSHVWQGYGSAIFLEFGDVSEGRRRRDGSRGNPKGEWTLMIEWSIEGKRLIWCGSWSDKERWPRALAHLKGSTVSSLHLLGRLPEIAVGFSNGLHLLSMMTAEGDPQWSLGKKTLEENIWLSVRAGRLQLQSGYRFGIAASNQLDGYLEPVRDFVPV